MPGAHALLSASGAKRWICCPPSARLEQDFEESTSSFAEEGTIAHELAELKLRKYNKEITTKQYAAKVKKLKTLADKKEIEIGHEMEDATDFYLDTVVEHFLAVKAETGTATLLIEQRLDFSTLVPEGFGTGDAVIIGDGVIEVLDLKYGKGVAVDATDNPQARLYAYGAYTQYSLIYDITAVRSTIIQPRLDSVSTEELTVDELLQWCEQEVRPKALLAWNGEGDYSSGEHCKFCRAKSVCRKRAEEALEALKYDFAVSPILTDEEIPTILPLLDKLTAWAKDVQEYAFQRALDGYKFDGYKLVEGRSNRKYSDEAVVTSVLLNSGLQIEDIFTKKLKGISDLEKTLGKARFTELLGEYVVKPQGKPTLVPETDKREEINSVYADFA